MLLTTVTIQRPEGTVLATSVAVQIEHASASEQADFLGRDERGGARPYDRFIVYTLRGVPTTPIRRRDVLIDEQNTDAETGVFAKYRVVGLPESFIGSHQELLAERVVGG